MKPYLDANIWISYVWFYKIGDGSGVKHTNVKVVERLQERQILSPFSSFLVAETSKHFKEWFLFQQALKDGFSFWQWKDVKKKYRLTQKDKDQINNIVQFISETKVADVIPNNKLSPESVEIINALVLEESIDFPDAIHVALAKELKCDYFVTNDDVVAQILKSRDGTDYPKCVKPMEFLRLI